MVKGHEIYDLLNNSFSDVFSTSNKIIKEGKICVSDYDIPVEIFLGGDYKVRFICMLIYPLVFGDGMSFAVFCNLNKIEKH